MAQRMCFLFPAGSPRLGRSPRVTATGLVLGLLCAGSLAHAWEAETTHVGLTEQAALSSKLHARLGSAHGRALGFYTPLAVPPAGAPALYAKLKRLLPSAGYVPDLGGQQSALGWLLAGAVLEDVPEERGRNHFYDPVHGQGLSAKDTRGFFARLRTRILAWIFSTNLGAGMAAPEWIRAPENDLGMQRFLAELAHSATAPTRGERDQHLAFALLCAGAMLHVLEDLGSPSRARDDLVEHLQPLTEGGADHGSRFERLAALLFGRLGVPTPSAPVHHARLRDFFTNAHGQGLADITARSWFSLGTLPASRHRYSFPEPSFDVRTAARTGGATVKNQQGVCLAHYALAHGHAIWSISDECAAEQLGVILPLVGAHATGLLDFLFRGTLAVTQAGQGAVIAVEHGGLGKGRLTTWVEDEHGHRQKLGGALDVESGRGDTALASVSAADLVGADKLVAVFQGVDDHGEEVVAIGELAIKP